MIIEFKQRFADTLDLFRKTVLLEEGPEENRSQSPPPTPTASEMYPLTGHCVAREEDFGYILVAYNTVFIIDKLTLLVLKMCNGLNSVSAIKQGVLAELMADKKSCAAGDCDFEAAVERALASLGKTGKIIMWMPHSQVHRKRHTG